ncbi:MAG: AMP-binding protein [Solirubrobacteraceae bacterium]
MDALPRLLGWLRDPPSGRGIRFCEESGWRCHPYDELADRARRTAAGLVDAGVPAGAVVALVQRAGPDFVATLFGTILAGATPAPLAPPQLFQDAGAYAEQAGARLAAASPAAIVAAPELHDRLAPLARASGAQLIDPARLAAAAPAAVGEAGGAPALLQFTSGCSGQARGVRVSRSALAANVAAIAGWLEMTPADGTASWLPIHHDMGLIGCLITPVATGVDLWLMSPEDFVRDPLRFLRCFDGGRARLTAMPAFALAHLARRLPAELLAGLDLSALRTIIIGAERIDADALQRFDRLCAGAGLPPSALRPAYGLAEATLAVTGLELGRRWRSVGVDPDSLALGTRVRPAPDGAQVVGCGRPLAAVGVEVRDADGGPIPDGTVGEIVVTGACVADGYRDGAPERPSQIEGGRLSTGDAGFVLDGELFVLGRLGDALKVRGRHVFAEDLELALVRAGIPPHRLAALLGEHRGAPIAVAVLEDAGAERAAAATRLLRRCVEHARIVVVDAPRGTVQRTSSGKPRRRHLWQQYAAGRLPGEVVADQPPHPSTTQSRPENRKLRGMRV